MVLTHLSSDANNRRILPPAAFEKFRDLLASQAAFSKKLENLKAALSLHFAWYNFCRIHSTLCVTPAMASGIAIEVWSPSMLLP
jgi:hypothetical protein